MTTTAPTGSAPTPAAAARAPDIASLSTGPRRAVPTILQMSEVECGAASLGMVLARLGRWVPLQQLRVACGISRDGATALDLVNAARSYGLEGSGHLGEWSKLDGLEMPAIIWLRRSHFAVLEGARHGRFYINDPGTGRYQLDAQEFAANYSNAALTFVKTDAFRPGGRKFRVMGALAQRLRRSNVGVTYAFVAGLLAMLLGLALAPVSKVFVNDILMTDRERGLGLLVATLITIGLMRSALTLLQYATLTRLQTKFSLVGSASFVDHLLRLPVEFYLQRSAGDLSQRVSYNTQVAQLLASQFAAAAIALVGVVGYAALLLYYQWVIGAIVIVLSLLNVVVLQIVVERRRTAQSRVVHEQNELRGTTVSAIKSIETLKATGMADQVFASLTGQQARYSSAQAAMVTSTAVLGAVPIVLLGLTSAAVLIIGSLFVLDGTFSFGSLLAMQTLAAGLYSPIQTLMGTGSQIQVIGASVQALDDVLVNPEDARYGRDAVHDDETRAFEGSISLRNVTFGYSRTHPPVLENFSLELPAGSRIALVGVSGSGKTTIGNLAAGLVEPWAGEVHFSGRPLSTFARRDLAGVLAKVDQSIVIFEGTVRENVTFWDRTIPDDDVVTALRDAQLLDEILARPDGIDATVAEDGRNFSGGQCQRMEIARALATNPRTIILDEATSALDATTEKAVDDALRARGVTCMIIAHRLSTIRDADEIVVLGRGGHVIERGTHDDLMAARGEYFTLVDGAGAGDDVGS